VTEPRITYRSAQLTRWLGLEVNHRDLDGPDERE